VPLQLYFSIVFLSSAFTSAALTYMERLNQEFVDLLSSALH